MDKTGAFIINEKVMFSPDTNSLCPVDDKTKPIALHTPSSQCLLILLQHNNEVVSQKLLFEEIWEKNGALVTANTLYQNIALIRKALKTAGIDEEIIKTVPKQGVKISARITFHNLNELNDITNNENHHKHQFSLPLEIKSFHPPASSDSIEKKADNRVMTPHGLIERVRHNIFFALVLPFFLNIALMYWLYTLLTPELDGKEFIKDYLDVGTINNCQVYSSYHAEELSKQKFSTMLQLSGMTCRPGDIAYLTFNRMSDLSVIQRCDKPITDKKAICQNYLYEERGESEK
ncbi:winged helix-turn-helix domain-containing protein [Atlantibacter sp.]|uniref:winged helix-turn-helix domain-containing protein n=1 Tax=Atlantibacter sp. TaxID=1903473 RepID=UPI0028A92887|nr:winged helix-turn-helix domain-containing protein [Atlantibacter sp.]